MGSRARRVAVTPTSNTPEAITPDPITPDPITPDAITPDAITPCWVGIDVAKHELMVAVRPRAGREPWSVACTPSAIASLARELVRLAPTRVALEASGGYERPIRHALAEAGLPVVVANPLAIRRFCQGSGRTAKTDRIDAEGIAHWVEVTRPPLRSATDAMTEEIEALLDRRRQLIGQRQAERSRLDTALPSVRSRIERHLAWLDGELADIGRELDERTRSNPTWQANVALLASVPGIGVLTATTLLASVPEIGSLDHKAIAALVGVAPMNRDSGTYHGKRSIRGGRADVRKALYMPTISARTHNPALRSFAAKLTSAGKPHKVVLIACMRKLLILCNAIMASATPWNPTHRALASTPALT
jgi:transposase